MLGAGALLRFVNIQKESLWLDEYWTVYRSTGRGQPGRSLMYPPFNVVLDPAPQTGFAGADPWWHVWTGMAPATHPPLYDICLRWWIDIFGDSDIATRGFSAALSLLSAVVLFDVMRRLQGPWYALVAAGIMVFSVVQIDHSQQTRNYTMAAVLGLLVCDAVVLIEQRGISWRRLLLLGISAAALALTHYLSVAPLLAIGIYAMLCLRGSQRKGIILALIAALLFVAFTWGPWLWEMRHDFAPQAFYLQKPLKPLAMAYLVLIVPNRLVLNAYGDMPMLSVIPIAILTCIVPLFKFRARPGVMMWWMWAIGSFGFIVLVDILKRTDMVYYTRYVYLASPAFCAILATPLPIRYRIGRWTPAILLLCTAMYGIDRMFLGEPPFLDWRGLSRQMDQTLGKRDLIAFTKATEFHPQFCYIAYRHYVPNSQRPIILLDGKQLSDQTRKLLADKYHVWMLSSELKDDVPRLFPGWDTGRYYNGPPGLAFLELIPPKQRD